jgi:hypothetical protein
MNHAVTILFGRLEPLAHGGVISLLLHALVCKIVNPLLELPDHLVLFRHSLSFS